MRTTIELDDKLRSQLRELAAQHGLRGISPLVQEAVEVWLRSQAGRQVALQRAADLMGSLAGEEGAALHLGADAARADVVPRDWE